MLTPPQVAARLGVSPDKILNWVRSGELRAINVAARRSGRPRYRIDLADLLAFEQARAAGAPAPSGRQRRRAAELEVIEFF
jgi:excisionase family DNA binding protein